MSLRHRDELGLVKHDPVAWDEGFAVGESATRTVLRFPYQAGRQGYSYSRGTLPPRPTDGFQDSQHQCEED